MGKKVCQHQWRVCHAQYGDDKKPGCVMIRRYCGKCKLEQHAWVKPKWRKSPPIGDNRLFDHHAWE